MKRKTIKQYQKELFDIGNKIICNTYIDTKTKTEHICNKCNYSFEAKPNNVLSGSGCPKCSNKYKRTTQEYMAEVKILGYVCLEDFINLKTKIKHICKCGTEWLVAPSSVLKNRKCNNCLNKISSNEDYLLKLSKINPNVFPLNVWSGSKTKINLKCLVCNNEWLSTPYNGCPKCANNNAKGPRKDKTQYIKELNKVTDVKILGDYLGAGKKTLHKCSCGNEWVVNPNCVLKGGHCRKCAYKNLNRVYETHGKDFYFNKQTFLYYIKVNNLYKIGITLKNKNDIETAIKRRFSSDINNKINIELLNYELFSNGSEAFELEQKILLKFHNLKYIGENILKSGNSKMFTENILKDKNAS